MIAGTGAFGALNEHPEFVELCGAFSWKPPAEARPIREHVANCVSCREKVYAFLADGDLLMAEVSANVGHEPEANIDWNYDPMEAERKAIAQTFVHAPLDLGEDAPAIAQPLSWNPVPPRALQKSRRMRPAFRVVCLS